MDIDYGNCMYECILMCVINCYGIDTCFMEHMDMLYGQGHEYAKYEMEIVLHCIWLIKGCQLCILVTEIMDMDMDLSTELRWLSNL